MASELTLERVEQCLRQGKAKAKELNVEAAIVVVDAAGHLVGALRMDNALWVTPEIAQAKAATAAAFRATTAELEERWKARPWFAMSVVGLGPGRFLVGKGAVPIIENGCVIGAVGVSGGIPADLDHQIAEAAVIA
ncbi:MAG: heme-binding protein [Acidobacteriota bacterium]|nr:heme-binding protein [Blastocatellia bacterium]MDW8238319.1 heme-binding protein [Acidobacteriota bacterium]